MQQAKTFALPSLSTFNDTGRPLASALWSILGKALSRGYAVVPTFTVDPIATRAERTRKGGVTEVEIYEDGSGLEVAILGRVFILGVERGPLLAASGGTLY